MLSFAGLVFLAFSAICQAAVLNTDPRYGNWLRGAGETTTRIPVYIDQARYVSDTSGTLANIRTAMNAVNGDLNGCVQFYEVSSPSPGRDFIWISPSSGTGAAAKTCASAPGRDTTQQGRGQLMLIVPGTGAGQCGGSVRQIMAKFANTLGILNEYLRPDRPFKVDTTKVDPSLAQYANIMYNPYPTGGNYVYPGGFDHNSVTMISGTTNAAPGQSVFTSPPTAPVAPYLNRISQTDCVAVVQRYSCGIFCQNPAVATNYVAPPPSPIPPNVHQGDVSVAFNTPISNIPGKSLVGFLIKYPAGGAAASHRHSPTSFIQGYVLQGAILQQVEGEPTAKIYQAGETFIETPGAHHIVSANADPNGGASSFIAIFVVDTRETGALVVPDK